MLDDDFKQIEDFLKTGGNLELQTLIQFEEVVDTLVKTIMNQKTLNFENGMQETFITLHGVIYESYIEYEKHKDDIMKDFAITILVTKKIVKMLGEIQENNVLNDEEEKRYLTLMKVVIDSLKKEITTHLNFFNIFSEYIDEMATTLAIKK